MFVTNGGRQRFALEDDVLDGTVHNPPGCDGCGVSVLQSSQNQLVTYEGFKIIVDGDVFAPHPNAGVLGCCVPHVTTANAESDQSVFSENVRPEVTQEELDRSYIISLPPSFNPWNIIDSRTGTTRRVSGPSPNSIIKLWNHNTNRQSAPEVIGSFLLKSYVNNNYANILAVLQEGRIPTQEELSRLGTYRVWISDDLAFPSQLATIFTDRWLAGGATSTILGFQQATISDITGTNNDGKITINGKIPVRLGDYSTCRAIIKQGSTIVL